MRWFSGYEHPKQLRFIIEHDENVGFYLFMYESTVLFQEDLAVGKGHCTSFQYDDLQDTLEWAKTIAFEDFGVPLDSWKQIE